MTAASAHIRDDVLDMETLSLEVGAGEPVRPSSPVAELHEGDSSSAWPGQVSPGLGGGRGVESARIS